MNLPYAAHLFFMVNEGLLSFKRAVYTINYFCYDLARGKQKMNRRSRVLFLNIAKFSK